MKATMLKIASFEVTRSVPLLNSRRPGNAARQLWTPYRLSRTALDTDANIQSLKGSNYSVLYGASSVRGVCACLGLLCATYLDDLNQSRYPSSNPAALVRPVRRLWV